MKIPLVPSIAIWATWSLANKLTALGTLFGLLSLIFGIVFGFWSNHNQELSDKEVVDKLINISKNIANGVYNSPNYNDISYVYALLQGVSKIAIINAGNEAEKIGNSNNTNHITNRTADGLKETAYRIKGKIKNRFLFDVFYQLTEDLKENRSFYKERISFEYQFNSEISLIPKKN